MDQREFIATEYAFKTWALKRRKTNRKTHDNTWETVCAEDAARNWVNQVEGFVSQNYIESSRQSETNMWFRSDFNDSMVSFSFDIQTNAHIIVDHKAIWIVTD